MEYEWDIDQRTPTFFSALDEWNHFEDLSREKYGADSLKDRDFQKLKLREYERLYRFYNVRTDLSRDERAMLLMLGFQRKKLRKALYPGQISRVLYRIGSYLRAKVQGAKINDPFGADTERYISTRWYPENKTQVTPQQTKQQGQQQQQQQGNRIPLGLRQNKNNNNGKRHTL